ncbi:hypothetical protein B0T19DRAFT_340 [Cercophora scortea]|uniref:Nitronate monooxygenase domain-containing protein n=1 Tax=Cercophora scortea TaxID=314031 RepID=A0AAE0J1C3_9PEZI|nr:hypothetical protein B0T19DRAFT_340 [Cercophora scortea]
MGMRRKSSLTWYFQRWKTRKNDDGVGIGSHEHMIPRPLARAFSRHSPKMDFPIHSLSHKHRLAATYPWTSSPLIISAPMRVMSGPDLAVSVSLSGGIGFIGPGLTPESTSLDLAAAKSVLPPDHNPETLLPIGVGFQLWNGSLSHASSALSTHRPCAAWLFAPSTQGGQSEVDQWTTTLRAASPQTQIWLQVGTVSAALAAARSATPPDVLVIQGCEAGGHGQVNLHGSGAGFITLLPEIADALRSSNIPLFAAGGISDGRGAVAALGVGAAGVVMGTRFLASKQARICKGYQDEVVRASEGSTSTVRTQLYNHLRGTFGWPEEYSPRTVVNRSWREEREGVPFDELKRKHDELVAQADGNEAWGPEGRTATYAGAGVGLVREVRDAGDIVREVREQACTIVKMLGQLADPS